MVVEILSPSNERYDLVIKRQLYERCGVPEYWIVSPEEHVITQLVLVDSRYTETQCTDEIAMSMPPHVKVDLKRVW